MIGTASASSSSSALGRSVQVTWLSCCTTGATGGRNHGIIWPSIHRWSVPKIAHLSTPTPSVWKFSPGWRDSSWRSLLAGMLTVGIVLIRNTDLNRNSFGGWTRTAIVNISSICIKLETEKVPPVRQPGELFRAWDIASVPLRNMDLPKQRPQKTCLAAYLEETQFRFSLR